MYRGLGQQLALKKTIKSKLSLILAISILPLANMLIFGTGFGLVGFMGAAVWNLPLHVAGGFVLRCAGTGVAVAALAFASFISSDPQE